MSRYTIEELHRLDMIEELGKKYHAKFGKNLSHAKYLLLTKYSNGSFPSIEYINSSAFEAESKKIEDLLAKQFSKMGLPASEFIKEDCDIEIEKLLRYVDIPKHHHDFLELVYVMRGVCYHTVEGVLYEQKTGCFTIINSSVDHQLSALDDCLCFTIKVRPDKFVNFNIPNLPSFAIPVCFECGNDEFIPSIILELYSQQESNLQYHSEMMTLLLQSILVYCMQNYGDTRQVLMSFPAKEGKWIGVLNYMYENYRSITMRELSRHFGYSEPYFSKLFHKETGKTFTEVLKEFKLREAAKLLQTKKLKLAKICEEVGYGDVTKFIKDFKKQYGMTPIKYQKSYMQKDVL